MHQASGYPQHPYEGSLRSICKGPVEKSRNSEDSDSLLTLKNQIIAYINEGNDVSAIEGINLLINDYNNNPDAANVIFEIAKKYYNIGRLYQTYEFYADANEEYEHTKEITERSIADLPKNDIDATVETYHLAAENYRRLKNHRKAAECYQKVVDLDPDFKYAWHAQFMVGYSYDRLWNRREIDKSEADKRIREAYEKLLKNYPNSAAVKAAKMWLNDNPKIEEGGTQ